MTDTTTYAAMLGTGPIRFIGPVLIALALIGWLYLTARGMTITARGTRGVRQALRRERKPLSHDRGPVKGGFHAYSPGIYSHSEPPRE
ncbi:hypothetical protein [Actinomadura flavalba]|uniref:hypothetical protein n=1 Tax=Actinomadura flavalba TaxID=1120938 RepID=UPI00036884DC|nr:hypothetical protein [Actinomadura flavalba]